MNLGNQGQAELATFDPRFRFPCTITMAGASQSGKTYRVLSWLRNLDEVFYNLPPEGYQIWYAHGPYQPCFKEFEDRVRFFQSFDDPLLSRSSLENSSNIFLIIDDCYSSIDPELLRYLVVALCHHRGITIILLVHQIYSSSIRYMRDINLSTTIFCFSYSPQISSMLRTFSQQFFGSSWKKFLEAAEYVLNGAGKDDADVNNRYNYITVDFSAYKPNKYRISTYLTNAEGPRCFFVFKD